MGLKRPTARLLRDHGIRVPGRLLRRDERFMRAVAGMLTRDDVVIDLGAHVGMASIEFAHRAGAVHAFEPHPGTFAQLLHNVRRYPRIHPVNAAVSDRAGTARLYYKDVADGRHYEGSTLMGDKDGMSEASHVDVATVRLPDFVIGLGRPVALVKMDVEGAEYRIIADLIETPAMDLIGKVYIECHADRVPGLAAERAAVEARIDALGLGGRFDFTWP